DAVVLGYYVAVFDDLIALHADDPGTAQHDGPARDVTRHVDRHVYPLWLIRGLFGQRIGARLETFLHRVGEGFEAVALQRIGADRVRALLHLVERIRDGEIPLQERAADRPIRLPPVIRPADEVATDHR